MLNMSHTCRRTGAPSTVVKPGDKAYTEALAIIRNPEPQHTDEQLRAAALIVLSFNCLNDDFQAACDAIGRSE